MRGRSSGDVHDIRSAVGYEILETQYFIIVGKNHWMTAVQLDSTVTFATPQAAIDRTLQLAVSGYSFTPGIKHCSTVG